jgi:DNA processing protein
MRTHLDESQRRDWLRLMRSENVGPVTFRLLLNRFGSAAESLDALPELSARGGLRRRVQIAAADEIDTELEALAKLGAAMVCAGEPGYPPLLAHTEDAPPLLALRGNRQIAHRPCVAIVGSRNCSATGMKVARILANDLADAGFTVVSGLARGIDRAAHEASLTAGTLAVLAGGLAQIYPQQNRPLANDILDQGLLVSEMPLTHAPRAQDFPRRNRIISGSSLGVVVIEAARRSGSLITARMAAEQNRDVFAVPGSVLDSRADGTNDLIRKGATLITSASHITEAVRPQIDALELEAGQTPSGFPRSGHPTLPFDMDDPHGAKPRPLAEERAESGADPHLPDRLFQLLSVAPIDLDSLCREAGVPVGQAASALLELELAGRVARHSGNRVSRTPEG